MTSASVEFAVCRLGSEPRGAGKRWSIQSAREAAKLTIAELLARHNVLNGDLVTHVIPVYTMLSRIHLTGNACLCRARGVRHILPGLDTPLRRHLFRVQERLGRKGVAVDASAYLRAKLYGQNSELTRGAGYE